MSQKLDFLTAGWGSGGDFDIVDPEKAITLYRVKTPGFFKPYTTLSRALQKESEDAITIGTISFSTWTSSIIIDMPQQKVSMTSSGIFSSSYTVSADFLNGKWQYPSIFSTSFEFISDDGNPAARFSYASFAWSKMGTLEVFGNPSQQVLDAIVITALVMMKEGESTPPSENPAMGASVAAAAGTI